MPDPLDIRNDRHALPSRKILNPDLEVFPHSARFHLGELRPKVVLEADFRAPPESQLNRQQEAVLIIPFCHYAVGRRDYVVGEVRKRISIMASSVGSSVAIHHSVAFVSHT
jgi:hypothetical protein